MIHEDLKTALTYNGIRELEAITLIPKKGIDKETINQNYQASEFVEINGILFLINFFTN